MSRLNQHYQHVINTLKSGNRPNLELSEEEIGEVQELLNSQLEGEFHPDAFAQALCLIDHHNRPEPLFAPALLKCLSHPGPSEDHLVFVLSALNKHLVSWCKQQSKDLPKDLFVELSLLIDKTHNHELLIWILELIKDLGREGIYFKDKVEELRPKLFQKFTHEGKELKNTIAVLEHTWRAYGL